MESSTEVERFLAEFKIKMNQWGLIFRDDRGKNRQTLADLDLTVSRCKEILNDLKVEDYCEGPVPDTLHKQVPLWVFGKMIKREEIYIKITLGRFSKEAVCISFHIASARMHYPLKR